jgi:N-acetylglucosamine kinase-like BadF-type ATPase
MEHSGDFLGLDCGGTNSRFAWASSRAGGTEPRGVQVAVHGVEVAADVLADVLARAMQVTKPLACVAAVAGAGDPALAQQLALATARRGCVVPIAVVGDVLGAAAAALAQGPGVMVWAGTGSFAIARAVDGSLHRTGGRGYLLGDQGSGYDLVRRAAAAALLALDGLGEPTALSEALTKAFAAPQPSRLGAVLQQRSTGEVAAQLPIVIDCAVRGDLVAQQVLQDGADALAMVANAAVRQAELDWRDLPVTFGGGVLTGVPMVHELVAERLRSFGAQTPSSVDDMAAARGAALLAQAWHQRAQPLCRWVTDGAL